MPLRSLCKLAMVAVLAAAIVQAGAAAGQSAPVTSTSHLRTELWGKTPQGQQVELFTLTNANGMEARIISYGGILVSLKVPDRDGVFADVVAGFDSLNGYLLPSDPYFGAIVGRYANRIANGAFTLDGVHYTLAKNNGPNSLHGGLRGFDKVVWKASPLGDQSVQLTYLSKDGEEGYPGNLSITVLYTLKANNELQIDYTATTDKDTVVNLSNHSYFNLAGQGVGDVLGQVVTINADRFTPVGKTLIPTGELRPVAGTPFDFRTPHAIGGRINLQDEQLIYGQGYDHNFVLNKTGSGLQLAATVTDPNSGRTMDVLTTQPGLQFYTGNQLDGAVHGKNGAVYGKRSLFAMETQHFPDSPNQPSFPSTELKPGATYHETTVFRFTAK